MAHFQGMVCGDMQTHLQHHKCGAQESLPLQVALGKAVDLRTIKIQPKSYMIVPIERFNPLGKKFPHGGLGKKMFKEKVDNMRVVWLDTSRDDEHIGCDPLERCQIEATIKKKMLENTFNDMVDNEDVEVPYFLPIIEEDSGSTINEGILVIDITFQHNYVLSLDLDYRLMC
jgi:hypothetical protein